MSAYQCHASAYLSLGKQTKLKGCCLNSAGKLPPPKNLKSKREQKGELDKR